MYMASLCRRETMCWWHENSAFLRAERPMESYIEYSDHRCDRWLETLENRNCLHSSVRLHRVCQSKTMKFRNNHVNSFFTSISSLSSMSSTKTSNSEYGRANFTKLSDIKLWKWLKLVEKLTRKITYLAFVKIFDPTKRS